MSDVRLMLGDCLDTMKGMADKSVDLVLTDPPYGIAKVWKGGFSSKHGWGKAGIQKDVRNEWDAEIPKQEVFDAMLSIGKTVVIWGGNYFPLPISRGWLVWVKPERNFTMSEAELAWTNVDMPMRVKEYRRSDPGRLHPTQKPLGLMKWVIQNNTSEGDTVLDPFMGSGTTGVACVELGRNFIGCEVNPDYFAIAEKRIEQARAQMVLPL